MAAATAATPAAQGSTTLYIQRGGLLQDWPQTTPHAPNRCWQCYMEEHKESEPAVAHCSGCGQGCCAACAGSLRGGRCAECATGTVKLSVWRYDDEEGNALECRVCCHSFCRQLAEGEERCWEHPAPVDASASQERRIAEAHHRHMHPQHSDAKLCYY